MSGNWRAGVFVVIAAVAPLTARAASIGINFTGGGNTSSPAVAMLAGDSAGVVPQINFNNFAGGSASGVALNDNTGVANGATLTFTSGGTYSSIGGAAIAPAGGDEKLNTGFVYGNGSFTVANIPYATYDVYAYMLNDASGRVETTTLTAGGPSQTFYGSAANPSDSGHVDQNAGTQYSYVQSTSTDSASPTSGGDYVRFAGLTAGSFTFTSAATGNGYINGIQVVQTPEPGTAAIVGIAMLAGLARRRRRSVVA
jgi:hypothetical protein